MTDQNDANSIRIAKRMAMAGIASRRQAEVMITEGRVKVDGEVITTPAIKVSSTQEILVDGKKIGQTAPLRMWLYHKPTGIVTTHNDPQGRPTVFESLPKDWGHVISAGRLDLNSEGLLILTTSGAAARYLEHPSNELKRVYRVRVYGELQWGKLKALKKGTTIDGIRYGNIAVKKAKDMGKEKTRKAKDDHKNQWLEVTLQEGKNREIRKVMQDQGLHVNRLIRLSYGPFELKQLASGKIIEISQEDVNKMMPELISIHNQTSGEFS